MFEPGKNYLKVSARYDPESEKDKVYAQLLVTLSNTVYNMGINLDNTPRLPWKYAEEFQIGSTILIVSEDLSIPSVYIKDALEAQQAVLDYSDPTRRYKASKSHKYQIIVDGKLFMLHITESDFQHWTELI